MRVYKSRKSFDHAFTETHNVLSETRRAGIYYRIIAEHSSIIHEHSPIIMKVRALDVSSLLII
jgi:hypothetical protein